MPRTLAYSLAVALFAATPHGWLQTRSLQDLTVPADRLPSGCVLSPTATMRVGDNRVRSGLWAALPIDRNPWIGSDRATTAAIREQLAPPSRLPDGPPLDTEQLARYRLQLADGIDRSYAAIYLDSGSNELIATYALEFPTGRDAAAFRNSARTSADTEVVTIGSIVAMVSGRDGRCLEAISAHVRGLP